MALWLLGRGGVGDGLTPNVDAVGTIMDDGEGGPGGEGDGGEGDGGEGNAGEGDGGEGDGGDGEGGKGDGGAGVGGDGEDGDGRVENEAGEGAVGEPVRIGGLGKGGEGEGGAGNVVMLPRAAPGGRGGHRIGGDAVGGGSGGEGDGLAQAAGEEALMLPCTRRHSRLEYGLIVTGRTTIRSQSQ